MKEKKEQTNGIISNPLRVSFSQTDSALCKY